MHRIPDPAPTLVRCARWLGAWAAALAAVLALALLAACRDDPLGVAVGARVPPHVYNPDWTEASHGRGSPNYAVVFPQDTVNTIEIVMTAEQWTEIRENMRRLWGFDFGVGVWAPCCCPCPDREPDYVDVTLRFHGKEWKHVGFRLKGNSSLETAWRYGIHKLPFRLQFDEFENLYPAIDNQRFYGFKELSMAPGFLDDSLIREKATADIFRMAGIPAARTAFYRVYIDFGAGPRYLGVYTMVEAIEDTMLKDQFGETHGNLYKPESTLRTFVRSEFPRKNNRTSTDYSDVRALVRVLNSDLRIRNAAQWRADLEAVLDVDHFLKWLAVNNAIVNWDTYGAIAHNYYLYAHSRRGLIWIPWDHNYSLTTTPLGGLSSDGPLGLSLGLDEVSGAWPLIRHLADDPIYVRRYREHMRAFHDGVLALPTLESLFESYHALIAPHVVGPDGEQPGHTFLSSHGAFLNALPALKAHIASRRALVGDFVR